MLSILDTISISPQTSSISGSENCYADQARLAWAKEVKARHPPPSPPLAKSLVIKVKLTLTFLQNMERNIILALLDCHYQRKEDF